MPRPTRIRRELLHQFGVLFAVAVMVAILGFALVLPDLDSPARGLMFIVVMVSLNLGVLFVFGGALIRRLLVKPMENLADDARRIARGDYHHRIRDSDSLELMHIQDSVNAMADRLIADQILLTENVASLEATNRDLIEARNQVVQAARLASVGTLAAGIAHEVGNPLGAVIAFTDVAKSRLQKEGANTELLDSIRDEAGRIDRIVRGLLDYARPRDVGVGSQSPSGVLGRVRELLESQGALEGLKTTWAVVGEVPEVVMEGHRLEQVMVNLILNAVHALEGREDPQLSIQLYEEPGLITLLPAKRDDDPAGINYLHRRRVSRDDGGRGIDPVFTAEHVATIRVVDNGPGIPEDDLESIFDPFFTTKEPGQGTGLGLSICARLVEGMGGSIEADNRPEGGASFTIRLPGVSEDDEPTELI